MRGRLAARMIRTILLASLLVLAVTPVAAADFCVLQVCIPPEEPPHCHMWDACGPPPCDSCDNGPSRG
jgi:hypothetical protein